MQSLTPSPSPVGRGENKYASLVKANCELRARTPFELTKCQVKWRGDAHGGVEPAEQSVDPLNVSIQAGGKGWGFDFESLNKAKI